MDPKTKTKQFRLVRLTVITALWVIIGIATYSWLVAAQPQAQPSADGACKGLTCPTPTSISSNAADRNQTLTDKVKELQKKYSILQCQGFAEELENWAKTNGYTGRFLRISSGAQFMITNRWPVPNQSITQNGNHYGIEIDSIVYDNLPKTGLPTQQWLEDIDTRNGHPIIVEERKFP
jgi:hypothetical protein